MPSAQIKSALMLAALNIRGRSTIIETIKTQNHTEKLFEHFGADIQTSLNDLSKGNYDMQAKISLQRDRYSRPKLHFLLLQPYIKRF